MDQIKRHPDFADEPVPREFVPGAEPPHDPGIVFTEEWDGIGNEFTGVRYRKVHTRNGERLQLHVPKHGYNILLDPMQLEIIAVQQPEVFSELHARQLGVMDPGSDHGDR